MTKNELSIIKTLGKGKSGISYLAEYKNTKVVLKEMHEEYVSYYNFSKEKINLELDSYRILSKININIPKLIDYNENEKYLIKEYINGPTITQKVIEGKLRDELILEMIKWQSILEQHSINIDYFPSNFILEGETIYYIDYEHNTYSEEWNYLNWGMYYWLNHEGFKKYNETGNANFINMEGTGKPIKSNELEQKKHKIIGNYLKMADNAEENLKSVNKKNVMKDKTLLADTGYFSEEI